MAFGAMFYLWHAVSALARLVRYGLLRFANNIRCSLKTIALVWRWQGRMRWVLMRRVASWRRARLFS